MTKLANILSTNNFPKKLINSLINNNPKLPLPNNIHSVSPTINLVIPNSSSEPSKLRYCSLVHINGLSQPIRRIFRDIYHIRLAFSMKKTIGKCLFTNLKDPVPQMKQSNLVYKIVRLHCDITYIGQTKQYFGDRIRQHKTDVTKLKLTTGLAQLSLEQEHNFGWDNPHILCL